MSMLSTYPVRVNKKNRICTSQFGSRNLFGMTFHQGIDLKANTGDIIVAAEDGIIAHVDNLGNSSYGKYIVIEHNKKYCSLYAHLSEIIIKPNDIIMAGETIGMAGMTGLVTGAHLHFEMRDGAYSNFNLKKIINPTEYIKEVVLSIDEAKSIIKEKLQIEEQTITYIWLYRWGDRLLRIIANALISEDLTTFS